MLRKVLTAASPSCSSLSSSSSAVTMVVGGQASHKKAMAAAMSSAPFAPTRISRMNQNSFVQNQQSNDVQTYQGRRSDYDFDKEQWAKQMKFASFDCIMEPSIIPPKYTSFEGIKKNVRRYLNMKKLSERRPGFKPEDLKELFIRYKYLLNAKAVDAASSSSLLLRLTTHTESSRIQKELAKKANETFKSKSWGSLRMDTKSAAAAAGGKNTNAASNSNKPAATISAAADATQPQHSAALISTANNANDVVLLIRRPDNYSIVVSDFALVTTYMAQMAAEDWLQLTFKCEYYEKILADGEVAYETMSENGGGSGASGGGGSEAEGGAATAPKKDKAAQERELLDRGYTKILEYPCFEVRMGDGVSGGVQYPFIVLGVMRRDGTRYGRDAQDAAALRKQFDKNRSWFS